MTDKRLTFIVCAGTFVMLYVLGYLMNTDMISLVTFHKHGTTISFIGMLLWLIVSIGILYLVQSMKKKRR